MSVTYGGTNVTFPDGSVLGTAGYVPFRNKIINGDMKIAQRGTVTGAGIDTYGGCDRWKVWCADGGESGRVTMSQSTDAPTGFSYSQKLEVTTAQTSISSGHGFELMQRIENINCADLGFGVANKYVTVSFWAKASKAGTYCVNLFYNGISTSKINVREVSLTSTWTYYTLTFSTDSAQALSLSGTSNVQLGIGLMFGSQWKNAVTTDTWSTHNGTNWVTSNQVNFFDTVGNTINISGVQLEPGSVATPFESIPYQQQIQLCQRYYLSYTLASTCTSWSVNSTQNLAIGYPVQMRAAPTYKGILSGSWSGNTPSENYNSKDGYTWYHTNYFYGNGSLVVGFEAEI